MNYIVRHPGEGITLYYDGEEFQQHRSKAARYETEEAQQEIESSDLKFAEIEPVDENWRQVNDFAFDMLTNVQPNHRI